MHNPIIAATQLKATARTIKVFIVNDAISVALQSPLKIVRAGGFVWSGSAQKPGGGAAGGIAAKHSDTSWDFCDPDSSNARCS
jgi:hypothetical protein